MTPEGDIDPRRLLAIPIKAVTDVKAGVRLSLTKAEVRDLPPVELDDD